MKFDADDEIFYTFEFDSCFWVGDKSAEELVRAKI